MILKVVVTLALIQGAVGSKCCFPDKWEGYTGISEGYKNGEKSGYITGSQAFSYDNSKKRVSLFQKLTMDGIQSSSQVIQDFASEKQYVIFNTTCQVQDLGLSVDHCIPDNAIHIGDSYFGGPDAKLQISSYMYRKNETNFTLTTTKTGCFPVGLQITGPLFGNDVMLTVGYTGITLGVKNESVFDIPPSCHHRRARSVKLPEIYQRVLSPAIVV